MDQKDQNSLSINDILDQLVKPQITQGPPRDQGRSLPKTPPADILSNPPEAQPQTLQKPISGGISLPKLGGQPQAPLQANISSSAPTPQSTQPKLYIRTMVNDLQRLSKGEAPMGLESESVFFTGKEPKKQPTQTPTQDPQLIPRPVRPAPSPPPPPKPEAPQRPKLSIPKLPSFSFGGGQQAQSPTPGVPPQSQPTPLPQRPSLPPIKAPEPQEQRSINLNNPASSQYPEDKVEYGVIAKVVGSGMTTGIISTIIVALALYFAIAYFVFDTEEIALPTPTPSSGPIATPVESNELPSIFGNIVSIPYEVSRQDKIDILSFKTFINNQTIDSRQFKKLTFIDSDTGQNTALKLTDILDKLSIGYPPELTSVQKDNNLVLFYGQTEMFDETGAPINTGVDKRFVLVTEVTNKEFTIDIMRRWEQSIAVDFSTFFDIDPTRQATVQFLDNDYKEAKVRYKNFSLPDRSLDYSVVTSLKGRHYLVISGSRESMFSPLDRIRGLSN